MDNFELFEKALNQIDNNKTITQKQKCKHVNINKENNIITCVDCGIELKSNTINYEKEWRYYGASDTRHNSDPNRCHIRKTEEKSIIKDVKQMRFSDKIVTQANELYQQVTKGKIYRGNSRKAIVFACIFHAYKLQGNPQSCEQLIKIFNLDKKIGLKGLKHVNLNAPKNSKIRTTYITPENLIYETMNKFNATDSQKQEVVELYNKIKNKSSILNRSRPQSVASGLIRYYILANDKGITMKDFMSKVNLSELTINRIVKEISRILETPNIS